MSQLFKRVALSLLATPAVGRVLAALRRDRCVIVMMHRFAGPGGSLHGHDPAQLGALLAYLRKAGVRLVDVEDAVASYAPGAQRGRRLPPAVAFTVDDGYEDFVTIGAPVFAEFDCPATCYVVPDVVDGKAWFWWDRLAWLLQGLRGHGFQMPVGEQMEAIAPSTPIHADPWQVALLDRLKAAGPEARVRCLAHLETVLGERCPTVAPAAYRVLSWDAMRAAERSGIRFGAHTMSHPVLNQCRPEEMRHEILGSIARVRSEVQRPSRVFAYPYGRRTDFGPREWQVLSEAGIDAAVGAEAGLVHPALQRDLGEAWRWQVPRYSFENRSGVVARSLFV